MKNALFALAAVLLLSACAQLSDQRAAFKFGGKTLAEIDPHAHPCRLGKPCRFIFPMTAAMNRRGDAFTLSGALGPFRCEECGRVEPGIMHIALLSDERVADILTLRYPGGEIGADGETEIYRFAETLHTPFAERITGWSLIDADAGVLYPGARAEE